LQPVVHRSDARRFTNRVLVQNNLFFRVFEGIQKAIVLVWRPESIEQVYFVSCRLFPLVKRRQGINIKKDRTAWLAKLGNNLVRLSHRDDFWKTMLGRLMVELSLMPSVDKKGGIAGSDLELKINIYPYI